MCVCVCVFVCVKTYAVHVLYLFSHLHEISDSTFIIFIQSTKTVLMY